MTRPAGKRKARRRFVDALVDRRVIAKRKKKYRKMVAEDIKAILKAQAKEKKNSTILAKYGKEADFPLATLRLSQSLVIYGMINLWNINRHVLVMHEHTNMRFRIKPMRGNDGLVNGMDVIRVR